MNDLAIENQRLQRTIQQLLKRIEENHEIQQRFHQFEMKLLSCDGLSSFFDELLVATAAEFELQSVSLWLYDGSYDIKGLFDFLKLGNYQQCLQLRQQADFFTSLYGRDPQVKLGPLEVLTASRLFPNAPQVASAALLPLMRGDEIIGSLHLASRSDERYSASKATDFLTRLASIIAICLDSYMARENLQRQGKLDALTGAHNRRSFELEWARELARAARSRDPLSCLFVDIDHFKQVNDQYGHAVGDTCLRDVAAAIKTELRETDCLARYGGEEFVVLLPAASPEQALLTAERIRLCVAELRVDLSLLSTGKQAPMGVTVSIGACSWLPQQQATEQVDKALLQAADQAMYRAKLAGRNRVEYQALTL